MKRRAIFILFVIILIVIVAQQTIRADASVVVNTTADEDGTGGNCSLREAITAANTNANYGGCVGVDAYGSDTITFDASVFSTSQTITLSSNLPNIATNMTIVGTGADLLTVSGATVYRPFYITSDASVSLSDLTVTQGKADFAGNIYIDSGTVTLDSVIVSHGWATNGAGIINRGSLTIQDSLVSNNTASEGGGGILNINFGMLIVRNTTFSNNGSNEMGGGIFNQHGHAFIQGSTFTNNTAMNGGGLASYDLAIVSNSTFSSNNAMDRGGGIATFYYQLELVNSTVSGNAAPTAGGLYVKSNMDMYNSILANSSGGDCIHVQGTLNAHHSLIEDGGCGIASGVDDNLTGDPLLQALANNGGTTQTMALSVSSPAIDAGSSSYLNGANYDADFGDFNGDGTFDDTLDTDQRGAARITNSTVDMGAFEYGSSASLSLIVDTTTDSNLTDCTDLPNDCSLRGAISRANLDIGAQLITFDASVFGISQTITLSSNLPNITTNMTIVGTGADLLTVSGATVYRPFYITSDASVGLSDLTVSQGHADVGGNVYIDSGSVTLSSVIVSDGWAFHGGGILNSSTTLIIQDSLVTHNTAQEGAGGILNLDFSMLIVRNTTFSNNGSNEMGGGIFNQHGHVFIQGSTFTNNTALNGGGLATYDTAIVSNSTFSGNSASYRGGGIYTHYQLDLINSTLSNNAAPTGGGLYLTRTANLFNSILANSGSGGDCNYHDGTFSAHNSLIEDGGCGLTSGVNGNLTGDPQLLALADNGGSTQTMMLSASSPAINTGNNTYFSEANLDLDFNHDGDTSDTLYTDQRGSVYSRVIGNTVDMGAYEVQQESPAASAPTLNFSETGMMILTWNRVSWATGYEVQISPTDTFSTLECSGTQQTAVMELSLTTCQLTRGIYYWRVKAVASSGTSVWSTPVSFVIASF